MDDFAKEAEALVRIYEILAPMGIGVYTRITNHLSLRLTAEAVEKEKLKTTIVEIAKSDSIGSEKKK